MPNENRFDFKTLTNKAEETLKCSLFPDSSVRSPVRRLPGEFTTTYFRTSLIPMGNMGAVNSVNTDHQIAGKVPFSGRSSPKLKLREFVGDTLEWSGMLQSSVGRSSLSNGENISHLKTLLTGAARRSVHGLGYSGSMSNVAWSTLERKFGQPHLIISARLSRIQSYLTMKYQDFESFLEFADNLSRFLGAFQQFGYSDDLFSSRNLELVPGKLLLDMR